MIDFLAIGDAGIDTLVDIHDASVQCRLHGHPSKECFLSLRFADKILVEGMLTKTAYNGMNAAIGAARLKVSSALFGTVGGDAGGERILKTLKDDKVSRRFMRVSSKQKTNASVVLNYKGERTILVYHEDYHYPTKIPTAKWTYLTTMGKRWPAVYQAVAKKASQEKINLAFNPGTHQLKAGVKKLKPVLAQATILFLNLEETQLLSDEKSNEPKKLLKAMHKLGASIAVMTDGPKGSYASDGARHFFMPIIPAKVIERTGCGDAFGTAFTVAMSQGKDIRDALRWGTANSAGVIQKIGPQDGLQTRGEILKILKKYSRVQPRAL